jgi:hypothetical protein
MRGSRKGDRLGGKGDIGLDTSWCTGDGGNGGPEWNFGNCGNGNNWGCGSGMGRHPEVWPINPSIGTSDAYERKTSALYIPSPGDGK